ncbi:TraC family protein [bacterium AH-315-F18]|nr:TraC family protein [bacterium AH-315-F18]
MELGLTKGHLKALYENGPSFPYYLPYHSIDPDGAVVSLVEGSIGLVWDITPVAADLKSDEALLALSDGLEGLLNRLPDNAIVQMIASTDPDVSEEVDRYRSCTVNNDALLSLVQDAKLEKISMREPHFVQHGVAYKTRRIRVYLTLRQKPTWAKPGLLDNIAYALGHRNVIQDHFETGYVEAKRRLLQTAEQIESLLAQLGVNCDRLDEDGIVESIYRQLHPQRAQHVPAPRYEDLMQGMAAEGSNSLRGGLVFCEPELNVDESSSFSLEGVQNRVVTLRTLAPSTRPGCITGEIEFGGSMFSLLDLVPDLTLVYNIEVPPRNAIQDLLTAKKSHAYRAMGGNGKDVSVENRALKDEVDEAILRTKVEGKRLLFTRLHLIVGGKDPQRLAVDTDRVVGALGRLGFDGLIEDAYGASLWLSCLPLAFDPANDGSLKRARRVLSPNLADMLPLYGTWRGTPTPDLLFLNRRGEPTTFSFFDSDSAPHGILAGRTGSGKSFFVNQMLLSLMRLDTHVFIFDKGNSYRRLCHLLGGQYVEISPDAPRTINPFYGTFSRERLRFLVSLLSEMAAGERADEVLYKREKTLLARAIGAAYRNKQRSVQYYSDADLDEHITPTTLIANQRKRVTCRVPRADCLAALKDLESADGAQLELEVLRIATLKLPRAWTDQAIVSDEELKAFQHKIHDQVRRIKGLGLRVEHRDDPDLFLDDAEYDPIAPQESDDEEACTMILDGTDDDEMIIILPDHTPETDGTGDLKEIYVPGSIRILYQREEDYLNLVRRRVPVERLDDEVVLRFRQQRDLEAALSVGLQVSGLSGDKSLEADEVTRFIDALPGQAVLQEEVYLSDVTNLLATDERFEAGGPDLAIRLGSFYGEGQYAGFFDGPNQVDFSNPMTVFELAEIGSDKELSTVLLLVLMYRITNFVQDPAMRGKQKYLLLDEAWTFLKSENTAGFLENAYRTFRKFGTCVLMITQQVSDFMGTPAGTAIRANAPNRILLEQSPDVVTAMAEDLDLDDKHVRVLKTVRTVKGRYSEALVISSQGSGVVRVVPDPVGYWLSTSDARDIAYLNGLQVTSSPGTNSKQALLDSIRQAAKDHPFGIR